jgi:hypothetical protein
MAVSGIAGVIGSNINAGIAKDAAIEAKRRKRQAAGRVRQREGSL